MWLVLLNGLAVSIVIFILLKNEVYSWLKTQKFHENVLYKSFQINKTKEATLYNRYWVRTHLNHKKELKYLISIEAMALLWLIYYYNMGYITICLLMALVLFVHVFMLEERLSYIDRCIDKSLLGYFASINAHLLEKQDLISALNQTEKSNISAFIKNDLHIFNASIRAGMPVQLAFDQLLKMTHHPYLKYVYLNIEQAFLKRGDVIALMGALEEEYTLIQIEHNKRRIELDQYKKMTWISLGIVSLTAWRVLQTHDYIRYYYREDAKGKPVMVLLVVLTLVGIGLLLKALKTRVD